MDPFLALDALPAEPRVWTLGSGPSGFDRPWKERLLRIVGGVLPVWRGGVGIEVHVAAARAVLERGGVFSTFVEGTIGGPPDRPTPFRRGAFVIALRTGAPIVPLAVAGTEVLYRGKRFATRILPPVDDGRAGRRGVERRPGARLPRGARRRPGARPRRSRRCSPRSSPRSTRGPSIPPTRRRRWPWLTGPAAGPAARPDPAGARRSRAILRAHAVRRIHPRPRRQHAARPDHPR